MSERRNKLSKLAEEVLRLDRNTLLVNLRFMDMALSRFEYLQDPEIKLATDGHFLVYDPVYILDVFKDEKEASVRDYLHVVFHCVYKHMFIHNMKDIPLWDLACDIAVEKTISDLGLKSTEAARRTKQEAVFRELEENIKTISADKIYYYFMDQCLSEDRIAALSQLFHADDHLFWYMDGEQKMLMLGLGSPEENTERDEDDDRSSEDSDEEGKGIPSSGDSSEEDEGPSSGGDDGRQGGSNNRNRSEISPAELEKDWQNIAEHMQMDLENFTKMQGRNAGTLMQNLREVNREKYNYEEFLRRFSVRGEVMKLDMDEFDYVFYTYGLKLYGNVPLIEPLEYKEVKRIREFVIAIDTSGSTSGDLVQRFIQKTYNILKSSESFFTRINVHIIQCDADIQEDAKITSQEEFDEYMKNMKLLGMGGTDFRPVFRYVDELIAQGEFQNLKGLIYFTDGCGNFPEYVPEYDTAFVFVDDGWNNYDVPSWAIRLVLQKEDI